MSVRRYDIGSLGAVERMPNGWLKAPGRLTRIGVFLYRDANGGVRRELRLAEEVFAPEATRSFSLVPVTVDHPPEMLDADNTSQYSVGSTGEVITREGDYLCSSIMITDAKGISAAEGGKQELSCGYSCDLEEKTGSYQGEVYDCIQRNIRGNHVSLVDRGRAGPNARLLLDKFDAVQEAPKERTDMEKVLINGVWYEVSSTIAQAYAAEQKAQKEKLDAAMQESASAKKETEQLKARADSLKEDLDKEKKLRADAENPEKIKARIKDRLALEKSAQHFLKDEKLDALSDREIKAKVVKVAYPTAKLDTVSDDYLQARFDSALEKVAEQPEDEAPEHLNQDSTTTRNDGTREPYAVRDKTIKEENERSKKQLRG